MGSRAGGRTLGVLVGLSLWGACVPDAGDGTPKDMIDAGTDTRAAGGTGGSGGAAGGSGGAAGGTGGAGGGTGGAGGSGGVAGSGGVGGSGGSGGKGGSGGTGGGTGGTGGVGGAGGNPCPAVPPEDVISDFESGDTKVIAISGRGPSPWGPSTDNTGGTINISAVQVEPPRCGSMFAMRVQIMGFTGWGAMPRAGFKPVGSPTPIDASMYRGIRFSARAVAAPMNVTLQLTDKHSVRTSGLCMDPKCNDHFGKAVPITTEWKTFTVYFGEMSQAGWGIPQGTALASDALWGIQLPPSAQAEYLIDDIHFIR